MYKHKCVFVCGSSADKFFDISTTSKIFFFLKIYTESDRSQ